jgi:hypothetical protein
MCSDCQLTMCAECKVACSECHSTICSSCQTTCLKCHTNIVCADCKAMCSDCPVYSLSCSFAAADIQDCFSSSASPKVRAGRVLGRCHAALGEHALSVSACDAAMELARRRRYLAVRSAGGAEQGAGGDIDGAPAMAIAAPSRSHLAPAPAPAPAQEAMGPVMGVLPPSRTQSVPPRMASALPNHKAHQWTNRSICVGHYCGIKGTMPWQQYQPRYRDVKECTSCGQQETNHGFLQEKGA